MISQPGGFSNAQVALPLILSSQEIKLLTRHLDSNIFSPLEVSRKCGSIQTKNFPSAPARSRLRRVPKLFPLRRIQNLALPNPFSHAPRRWAAMKRFLLPLSLLCLTLSLMSQALAQTSGPPKVMLFERDEFMPGTAEAHERESNNFVRMLANAKNVSGEKSYYRIGKTPIAAITNEVM